MWGPGLATTGTLSILSTKSAKPWRLEFGVKLPLSSFADDLGSSSKVSGALAWMMPTFLLRPPSSQISCTYLNCCVCWWCSSPLLGWKFLCFIFLLPFLNWVRELHKPCTISSARKQGNLLLFDLRDHHHSWSQWLSLKWLRVIAMPNHIYLIFIPLQFCFLLSTQTVAPAPCLYWPSLGWRQAVRTIQVSCWPHACRDAPSLGDYYIPQTIKKNLFVEKSDLFFFGFCCFEALPSNLEVWVSLF